MNKKRFNSRRKVDSELAATKSVGSVFQMRGAATAKARLSTVEFDGRYHEAVGIVDQASR